MYSGFVLGTREQSMSLSKREMLDLVLSAITALASTFQIPIFR